MRIERIQVPLVLDREIERMKILLPIFLLMCLSVYGETSRGFMMPYSIDSVVPDKRIESGKSICHFRVIGIHNTAETHFLDYGVDDAVSRLSFELDTYFSIPLSAGKHSFQFFYNDRYLEISIPEMEIYGGARTYIALQFNRSDEIIISAKPVIYLYPQTATHASVKIQPKGSHHFFYPGVDGQWDVLAHPDGTLETEDSNSYRYLFWEAQQQMGDVTIDPSEGFLIAGAETLDFLEATLNSIGFNSKERADFITFWAPKMQANAWNYIHFMSGETCQQFGELQIDPRPDELFRFYILWHPADAGLQPSPQELPHFNRSGFSVLEWGGQEYPKNSLYPFL